MYFKKVILLVTSIFFSSCSQTTGSDNGSYNDSSNNNQDTGAPVFSDTLSFENTDEGICETGCSYVQPSYPIIAEDGGSGDITTYGSTTNPMPSDGGACNYGKTSVYYYAASNVNIESNDDNGHWQDGRICGQCVKVGTKTETGWKVTVVRITDKCPDEFCGMDLGGAPAKEVMGDNVGRYDGQWEFVSCKEYEKYVSDGPPAISVKGGSNEFWSLVHIRNPNAAVLKIDWKTDSSSGTMPWATEAENFFKVPLEILQLSSVVHLTIFYNDDTQHEIDIVGNQLAMELALYPLE